MIDNEIIVQENEKVGLLVIGEDESLMEGNFLEIPFVSLKKDARKQTKMEHYWVDSHKIRHGIIVKGSIDLGLPSIFEFKVLMGLFKLYSSGQTFKYNKDEKIYDMPKEINFTFSALAKAMGYTSCSSWTIKKIDEALTILLETTLYNTGAGAIYDPETKEYIIEFQGKKGFHIFDSYSAYMYRDLRHNEKRLDGNKVKNKTQVVISDFFHHSLMNKYFKIYDDIEYMQLSNDLAIKLYGILIKWSHGSVKRLKYETLYQRLGLDLDRKNKENNRLIKKGLEDLKKIGYLKDFETDKGGIILYYPTYKGDEEVYNLDKYNTEAEVVCCLHEHGLTYDEITKYCSDNMSVARKVLRLLDNKLADKTVVHTKKFIIAGLKEKYQINNKYNSEMA